MNFEVWHHTRTKSYLLAGFSYWQECLDFLDYCRERKAIVTLRTLNPGHNYLSIHNYCQQ